MQAHELTVLDSSNIVLHPLQDLFGLQGETWPKRCIKHLDAVPRDPFPNLPPGLRSWTKLTYASVKLAANIASLAATEFRPNKSWSSEPWKTDVKSLVSAIQHGTALGLTSERRIIAWDKFFEEVREQGLSRDCLVKEKSPRSQVHVICVPSLCSVEQ
jgi:hypothetical protein